MTTNYNKKWYKPTKLSTKILITTIILLFIRLCANIPVPFINKTYLDIMFADKSAFALINSFSGGSFTEMSLMALSVTPYITASIILQLLTIVFPKLADIPKDGIAGKKKWETIQFCVGIALGIIQSIGIAITFGKQGLFTTYNIGTVMLVSLLWTIGSVITIGAGTYITKCCIGNGISLILAINIISALPGDVINFYTVYMKNQPTVDAIISCVAFIVILLLLIAGTVILNGAQKEISVIYPKTAVKNSSRKSVSSIPIKLNIAGVMPVIFTSTLFSLPLMFLSNSSNKVAQAIIHFCSSTYWFDSEHWWRTLGFVVYGLMVVFFAYFYAAIVFNPYEISQNLKKSGACIPGIRPGQPTIEYLEKQSKYITLIGAIFLFMLTQIPMFITQFTKLGYLSFGGTSVIIIVGVVLDFVTTIRSERLAVTYSTVSSTSSFLGLKTNQTVRKGVF